MYPSFPPFLPTLHRQQLNRRSVLLAPPHFARQKVNPDVSGAVKVVNVKGGSGKGGQGRTPKRKGPSLDLDQLVRDPTATLGTGQDGW